MSVQVWGVDAKKEHGGRLQNEELEQTSAERNQENQNPHLISHNRDRFIITDPRTVKILGGTQDPARPSHQPILAPTTISTTLSYVQYLLVHVSFVSACRYLNLKHL